MNTILGNKPILTPVKFQKNDIVEILVGPCCNFTEAKKSIRLILKNNRYKVDCIPIKYADLPFQSF